MTAIVCGVGINDVGKICDGHGKREPSYEAWVNMIYRCYSSRLHDRRPGYKETQVCDEWKLYSNFKKWWHEHSINGWDLDKDLINGSLKIYSPETCIYIPRWVNTFLRVKPAHKDLPIGCSFHKASGKYRAVINIESKLVHLGLFDNPIQAHYAWKAKKLEYLESRKDEINRIDGRLFGAMIAKVDSWSPSP